MNFSIPVLVAFSALSAPLAAQVTLNGELLAPCISQSEDLDGDGIGYNVSFNYEQSLDPNIAYTLVGKSCLVTVESEPPPDLINLETGAPVTLRRINWNEDDLVGKPIVCQVHEYDDSIGQYRPSDWLLNHSYTIDNNQAIPYQGTVISAFQSVGEEPLTGWDEGWFVEDGKYYGPGLRSISNYAEFVGSSMRIWGTSQESYRDCKYQSGAESLRPDSRPPTENITDLYYVECVDTFPLGNGWGWDGHKSCNYNANGDNVRYVTPEYVGAPPNANISQCSYVDALLYDGWGWNATTGQSCPPEDDSTEAVAECVDSDGDGWGWDGVKSCVVSEAPADDCSYADADIHDGWGWNPVTGKSCAPRL